VILCPDLDGITAARQAIEQFLDSLDLHLSPTKTRVTHTFHLHEGAVGFDFLGFTIRQYARGVRHCGKNWRGERLGFKTLIKPSKDAIMRHTRHLDETVRRSMQVPQEELIDRLNPIIRGWANYYRTAVAAATFHRCDSQVYWRLRSCATRRHPLKGRHWITRHYWNLSPGAKWDFVVKQDGAIVSRLRRHTNTHIRRHIQVRGNASPYDGNLRYGATRLRNHPLTGTTLGRLLSTQQGTCSSCGLLFTATDVLEIDHIIPLSQGGSERLDNKHALHRHCHDQKPALTVLAGTTDKDHVIEEPDKVKTLCPVLEGGGRR
jgi:RNA-directed DNA polymerase